MDFEWDELKAQGNITKHGISFENARLVFFDPERITLADTRFDYGEERFITFGRLKDRLCVVVFTKAEDAKTIRIISARKANLRERKRYGDS
jgi:uncharacterized DUF497 family protein